MDKKKKTDLALLAQGINGIAEMYVEIKRMSDTLCERVMRLNADLAALEARMDAVERQVAAEGAAYATPTAEEMLEEYCYGKCGVRDE